MYVDISVHFSEQNISLQEEAILDFASGSVDGFSPLQLIFQLAILGIRQNAQRSVISHGSIRSANQISVTLLEQCSRAGNLLISPSVSTSRFL